MLPTIVTSSPSRIQTVPRPITTSQWNRDHGRRSSRAGICGLDHDLAVPAVDGTAPGLPGDAARRNAVPGV